MYDYRDDVAAQYRQTYDRILARDAALFDADRERFEHMGAKAWDWRYLPAVAANYRVRLDKGIAGEAERFRLAEVLTALEQYEEAWALFAQPMPTLEGAIVYWFRMAEALVGLGRLEEARDAAARALGLAGGAKGPRRLAESIERLTTLETQLQGELSWPEAAEFVTEALTLNARPAVSRLVSRMAKAPPPTTVDLVDVVAAVARAALAVKSEAAQALIDIVLGLERKGESLSALRLERDLREGLAERARAFAERRRGKVKSRDVLYLGALAAEASGEREQAIRELGPLASKFDRDHDIRSALARFVGEDVLARTKPIFAPVAPGERRRVINLIPFNNEITMLETRLREMADWVDLFVIVEAAQTFMGGPKRCGFDEIKDQYAEYGDKIRHVKLDAFPDYVDTAWARDCWQRDMAIAAIDGWWRPDDLVLLTDSDEIVQRDAVADFEIGQIALKMKTYRYFFNYEAQPGNPKNDGHTGVICTADQLGRYGSSYIRFSLSRASKSWNFIPRAGWHFTSMGDAETLVRKFSSYAHQERNKTKLKDTGRMGALLEGIRAGRFEDGWARCEIDDSFPAVIRERQEDLGDLVL